MGNPKKDKQPQRDRCTNQDREGGQALRPSLSNGNGIGAQIRARFPSLSKRVIRNFAKQAGKRAQHFQLSGLSFSHASNAAVAEVFNRLGATKDLVTDGTNKIHAVAVNGVRSDSDTTSEKICLASFTSVTKDLVPDDTNKIHVAVNGVRLDSDTTSEKICLTPVAYEEDASSSLDLDLCSRTFENGVRLDSDTTSEKICLTPVAYEEDASSSLDLDLCSRTAVNVVDWSQLLQGIQDIGSDFSDEVSSIDMEAEYNQSEISSPISDSRKITTLNNPRRSKRLKSYCLPSQCNLGNFSRKSGALCQWRANDVFVKYNWEEDKYSLFNNKHGVINMTSSDIRSKIRLGKCNMM